MKSVVITACFGLATFVGACVLGCGTTAPSAELRDARSGYQNVTRSPTAPAVQPEIQDAKRSLDRAEAAFQDSPSKDETRDFAYIAQRKMIAAQAMANAIASLEQKKMLQQELQALNAQRDANAKGMLANAKNQLSQERGALDSERQARASAEQRTRDALDKIAGLKAEQQARGLVITLSGSVLFASSKSELLPASQKRLEEVATALKADGRSIVIVGHTDSQGADQMNLDLSKKRAEAVKAYLTTHGVPADKVRAEGAGKAEPIADNTTAEGRANNRRVEIVIQNEPPK